MKSYVVLVTIEEREVDEEGQIESGSDETLIYEAFGEYRTAEEAFAFYHGLHKGTFYDESPEARVHAEGG